MMRLNVNTTELVSFTNRLEKLHRSAFPNAVRSSLNSAAFDVKKDTLISSSKRNFTIRNRNFFKSNSRVNMAQGWELSGMKAEVGMHSNKKNTDNAVEDLEQQERGGTIQDKAFIAMDSARVSKSKEKNVRKPNRLSSLNDMIRADKMNARSKKQRFAMAVKKANVSGIFLDEDETVWKVNSMNKNSKGFDLTALYRFKEGRSVKVKATRFMSEAAEESHNKIDDFYIREAEKQFEKALRR